MFVIARKYPYVGFCTNGYLNAVNDNSTADIFFKKLVFNYYPKFKKLEIKKHNLLSKSI